MDGGSSSTERDGPSGLDLAAERPEVGDECVGDRLRSPAGHGPAVGVAEQGEDEPERRSRAAAQRLHRVRREPHEQRLPPLALEAARQPCGGAERIEAEPGGADGVARKRAGAEQKRHEPVVLPDERLDQLPVGRPVRSEPGGRRLDRPLERDSGSVVQRMREERIGVDELQSVLRKRQLSEERRSGRRRMDRGTDVVHESGLGQLCRAGPSSNGLRALDDQRRAACARHRDRRGETVRARSDDDGVRHRATAR